MSKDDLTAIPSRKQRASVKDDLTNVLKLVKGFRPREWERSTSADS